MHPYLTGNIPGTGGIFKETPEDFLVTEIPIYTPCGEGEHIYAEIEKRGITTLEAIRRLAKALGIGERDVGYAGMKDAKGITRQTISLPRVAPEQVLGLELPGIKVLSAVPHRNKLKVGHLRGNRFRIRIGGVGADAATIAIAVLDILEKRGVPNFFGEQRYGAQGNSHLIGGAILRNDYRGAVDALIGEPDKVTDERWRRAIEAFKAGDLAKSLETFPPHCRTERELLQKLVKQPEAHEKAFRAVHPRLRKLYLSAFQADLFDRVVQQRMDSLDQVVHGDVAFKHDNGACFLVTDAAAEAPRAAAFEISATGPMFGCRMKEPEGETLAMERRLLETEDLTLPSFDLEGGLRMEGERRPLRVPIAEIGVEADGAGLFLEFSLPKGSYATTVLREVMKS
ncbi:tRNA pseudouridine13 synthase [Geotalea daltonii FRC-32]|uniref:tRNA pseudouridine synthase D n=1 Tax=Geotalea daltonii (strain DSM 22248 / JCM 15807 / FRC-32) TaxID=316067 RepID=TRUD_GEODF|nr:RecName: Full=tRNA pseudouridine synthase D; AltName: Full=tRNA pseudouridine(13) synthase; AltName: Full=tRNA pseudouridylate synthase D; AltName: Full=tRNA-uridine isomerase D [Geotalea daltonii FRC-32]ACM20025.1 tRNA pseudouridine13 synthase [Geotalea daltonii FRC-32]